MHRHMQPDFLRQFAHHGFERRLTRFKAATWCGPDDAANGPGREVVPCQEKAVVGVDKQSAGGVSQSRWLHRMRVTTRCGGTPDPRQSRAQGAVA